MSKDENYGALVGWTTSVTGERLGLRLQTVSKPPPHRKEDVQSFYVMLSRQQAAQLGTTLFKAAGHSMPDRPRRSWLARFFGG